MPAFVHRLSDDRQRVYVDEFPVEPPSPVKRMRTEAHSHRRDSQREPLVEHDPMSTDEPFERYQLGIFEENDEAPLPPPPTERVARVVKPGDPSLHSWRAKRDDFLGVLMWLDGTRTSNLDSCPGCQWSKTLPLFRCKDCHGGLTYCQDCFVDRHRDNPLHRVYQWNGVFFVKTSLKALGLRVQLGHPPHSVCSAPEPANVAFVTLHTNGIHEVSVDYCGCENACDAGPPEVQLLRAGWFPATHERPQTCATLEVLEQFQQETLQSKMTMYDFYAVLERLTDNTGIVPPDRKHEWNRMCREFRHLMMLKRAGRARAYDPSGVDGTKQGELAIQCPACPRPGINLPEGWEKASLEERFLYTFFFALDACFRLKRRLVSSELWDPDLGSGWGYFVDTGPYREYLRGVTDQKEMKTCTGLAALDYANTKYSRGYATTGVAMGVCARHEFVQPNGVGDLQKGERFVNVDWVLASILQHKHPLLFLLITYDIVCIWSKYLLDRLKKLPPKVRLFIAAILVRFAIPKMHIHAHTLLCQLLFSLNWLLGAAEVDGEGIERPWSNLGPLGMSTMRMGPGFRHDTMECQLGYWNWQKLITIVQTLRRRLNRAESELKEQTEAFEVFSEQQRDRVPEWKAAVLAHEKDPEMPNPYGTTVKGLTEAEVRLQFAQEEAKEAERGVPSLHDVSPSTFIASALELEEEQRRVRLQAELKKAGTTGMEIDMKALRTKLNRGLTRFRKLQQTYMPAALQALGALDLPPETLAEDVPLLLPSALTVAQRERCVAGLGEIETLMRDAQCRTALVRLRNQLHIKTRLLNYKKIHARAQGATTRAATIVVRNESKIRLHSEKYQTAWQALKHLNGGDEHRIGWRVLRKEDIRCMEDAEELSKKAKLRREQRDQRLKRNRALRDGGLLPVEEDEDMEWEGGGIGRGGENERQVSWIWVVAEATGTDLQLEDALKVEWSKAFARTRRWEEERRLLNAEYARVGLSFEHEAAKWEARAAAVPVGVIPRADAEGAIAYAQRQAAMYRDLKARGEGEWNNPKPMRGKKKARHVPAVVGSLRQAAASGLTALGLEQDSDEDDARGDRWILRGGAEATSAGDECGRRACGLCGGGWRACIERAYSACIKDGARGVRCAAGSGSGGSTGSAHRALALRAARGCACIARALSTECGARRGAGAACIEEHVHGALASRAARRAAGAGRAYIERGVRRVCVAWATYIKGGRRGAHVPRTRRAAGSAVAWATFIKDGAPASGARASRAARLHRARVQAAGAGGARVLR
ncbi:hypothetical protein B0H11DRAFT_2364591 [Mycena galericulata]|nr:hypothetical protein B0H11DRAFT_2364591 [Mycena galericulata]